MCFIFLFKKVQRMSIELSTSAFVSLKKSERDCKKVASSCLPFSVKNIMRHRLSISPCFEYTSSSLSSSFVISAKFDFFKPNLSIIIETDKFSY